MKLGAWVTGAATTALVLGAVALRTPAQSTAPNATRSPAALPPSPLKFDHVAHAALETPVNVDDCKLCHGDGSQGVLGKPASHGHQPCLASGCHAEDFMSVGKRTMQDAPDRYNEAAGFCLGCHSDGAGRAPKPFAKAKADNLFRNNACPGHYVEMNHWAHTRAATVDGGDCRTCHVVDRETFVLAPDGPGHSECVTCHDGQGAGGDAAQPDFAMDECVRCHQPGSPASYFVKREFSSDVRSCNSVRYEALLKKRKTKVPCFEHEREGHRFRTNGEAVQCGHCHFMFSSKRYEGHGYQTLLQVKKAPLMDNSRDRAHTKCGTSGCHKSAVDDSRGTGKCALCHSSRAILDSLVGGESRGTTENLNVDSGDRDTKPAKQPPEPTH